MKIILRKPRSHNYQIANHIEFHRESYQICLKYEDIIRQPDLITAYHDAITQEKHGFKQVRASEFTKKKYLADRRRDETYIGLLGIVRSNLKHFDPSIQHKAKHLYNLMTNYDNLTGNKYDAKSADIRSVVARLRSNEYAEAVQTLGLTPWIDELETRNQLFKELVVAMAEEKTGKPKIKSRDARRITDNALRAITDRVTAQINLGNRDVYAPFVAAFNVIVEHYNTLLYRHLGRLHARIDITGADVATIDPQPFTGKPVFVIPAVTLADSNGKTVELIFTEDFTLAYRNNVNPGTATVIITGAGRYKGEIVTAFNIITEASGDS
jgi:hypothetical protein